MASKRPRLPPMTPYRNHSGRSGVVAYALARDAILLEFAQGDVYEYTARSAGPGAIAEMRSRAERGSGLATYVSQHVRGRYARHFEAGPRERPDSPPAHRAPRLSR
ncbi:MAG: hypothetical protein ACTHL8_00315 [Burkholderiaceae bacterium]